MAYSRNDNEGLALKIGGALLFYIAIAKPILEYLGISKGAGTRNFELQNADPNSPFSVDYWRKYIYSANTPANGRKPFTKEMNDRLRVAANYFYYGFGYITDDEAAIFKAVGMCKSKAEVSLLSFFIQSVYGGNMLSLMKFGKGDLPQAGLSENEMQNIFNKVAKLPTV